MTGSPPELRSFLEAEMFYGVKKRERIAYAVAGGGLRYAQKLVTRDQAAD